MECLVVLGSAILEICGNMTIELPGIPFNVLVSHLLLRHQDLPSKGYREFI